MIFGVTQVWAEEIYIQCCISASDLFRIHGSFLHCRPRIFCSLNSKLILYVRRTRKKGSRVGSVVTALASHQCVPGLIPGPGVIYGLSLSLVLCSERFLSGYSGFPLSLKTNISKFQFDPGMHGHFLTSSFDLLGQSVSKQMTFFTKNPSPRWDLNPRPRDLVGCSNH